MNFSINFDIIKSSADFFQLAYDVRAKAEASRSLKLTTLDYTTKKEAFYLKTKPTGSARIIRSYPLGPQKTKGLTSNRNLNIKHRFSKTSFNKRIPFHVRKRKSIAIVELIYRVEKMSVASAGYFKYFFEPEMGKIFNKRKT